MTISLLTTIVSAATSYDLIDLVTLKDDLAITGTGDDAFLTRAITRCSAAVAQFCNRSFAVETIQDQWVSPFSGYPGTIRPDSGPLRLSHFPVVAIITLSEYGAALVAEQDYWLDATDGLVYRLAATGRQATWVPAQTAVTYTAGFASIPPDVQDAVSRLVKARYAARTRDPLLRSESIPGVASASYAVGAGGEGANVPPEVADALSSYRVPVLA